MVRPALRQVAVAQCDAVTAVAGDDVVVEGADAADRERSGRVDVNAVAGIREGEDLQSGGRDADEVPLDQVAVGGAAFQEDAVLAVTQDEVEFKRLAAADLHARTVDDDAVPGVAVVDGADRRAAGRERERADLVAEDPHAGRGGAREDAGCGVAVDGIEVRCVGSLVVADGVGRADEQAEACRVDAGHGRVGPRVDVDAHVVVADIDDLRGAEAHQVAHDEVW